jgi:hypothetical protein
MNMNKCCLSIIVSTFLLAMNLSLPQVFGVDCNGTGIDDALELGAVYIGTQGGTGIGRVYKYLRNVDPLNPANNWIDLTPSPAWNVAAVMDLVIFQGKLYAGVQTEHGQGGGSGNGHVWRYGYPGGWVQVTGNNPTYLDSSVMVLKVLGDKYSENVGLWSENIRRFLVFEPSVR